MANGHGGPRTPSSPAPVSGPGALSKRTDGGPGAKQPMRVPTGGTYGQAQQMQQIQQGAPMGASGGGDAAGGMLQGLAIPEGPGAHAPSQQPDVPVTDGAALGPGAGPEALGLQSQPDEDLARLVQYLPVFEHLANQPGSSKAARNLVRELKSYGG